MDALVQRFASTGRFSPDSAERSPSRDRIRYNVQANRVLTRKTLGADEYTSILLVVPLYETWVATSVRLHNTNPTTAHIVTLRDVPRGGSNTEDFQWCRLTIQPNETIYLYGIEEVWDGGYEIYGWADVAGEVLLKIQGTPLVDA